MRPRTCSLPDCPDRHYARGFCKLHYERWYSHGTPQDPTRAAAGEPQAWLTDLTEAWWPVCIPWPYSRSRKGYGFVHWEGTNRYATRVLLELTRGPAPTARHQAAHSCGNPWCVNWRHLSWKTPRENEQDKRGHGTYNRRWLNSQTV